MLVSILFLALLPVLLLLFQRLTENEWGSTGIGWGFLTTILLASLGVFALWRTRFLTAESEWNTVTKVAVYASVGTGLLLIVLTVVGYVVGVLLLLALIAIGAD